MIEKKTKQVRLREFVEGIIDSDIFYDGSFEKLDYYNLFCKAASKDKVQTIMGVNLCLFNCKYNEKDSVMLIFYIPINNEENNSKTVTERVIEIINECEKCFTTLPYVNSEEIKEEKFVYVTIIKDI